MRELSQRCSPVSFWGNTAAATLKNGQLEIATEKRIVKGYCRQQGA